MEAVGERREQGDPSVSASGLQETVCGARPADGDLTAEALAGEGRRAGAARGLLGDHSNELCRGSLG